MIMMKHCAPFLNKEREVTGSGGIASHGSIINISSTRALMSEANSEGYAASKVAFFLNDIHNATVALL